MAQPSQKIIIIGGGLGGLALGQGLRRTRIPFTIFERDEAAAFRAQGYRIRINQDGGDALKQLLPPETFNKFEASCSEVLAGGCVLNALTGKEEDTTGGMPPQHGKAWNADRTVLRGVLLTDLGEHVRFGKKFQRYELLEQGVRAYFTDGSSEDGTLLIGVDGTRSVVRQQMLPDSVLLDTEGRAVFGKTPIGPETLDSIPSQLSRGMSLVGEGVGSPMKLLFDIMRFRRDVEIDLPQDYIYWVLVFHRTLIGKLDTESMSYSHAQSVDLADKLTSTWHESVRSILDQQLPEAASTLTFSMTKPPLMQWPADRRIIIMGDAAHAMPPVGGVGANAAFRDAAELLPILERGSNNVELGEFETSMRDRCNKILVQVGSGSARFFGMKPVLELKPVELHV